MKRLSIVLTALLSLFIFTNQSMAQQVPNRARKAFNQKFPDAQHVNWGKESADEYEAEFTLKGKQMSANFDSRGNWKETEAAIAEKDLPYAVRKTMRRDYEEAEVMHAYKITSSGETQYEVEVKMDGDEEMNQEENDEDQEQGEENDEEMEEQHENNVHELVFTKDGKVVNKEEAGEEEEGND